MMICVVKTATTIVNATHLDAFSFVLGFEQDLLNRLDPFISALLGLRGKGVIFVRSAQFESMLVNCVTA